MNFTDTQIGYLVSPLSSKHVKTREQGRSTLSYVESWHAIAEANRIFGFDAWNRETINATCVSERERKIGKQPYEKDGWGVTYTAKVRVTVGDIIREGTGAGHGIDVDLGQAHESAIKEAESDAMKRALMTFGNPFGLALYDKTQANVSDEPSKPSTPSPKTSESKQETKYPLQEKERRELWSRMMDDLRGEAPKGSTSMVLYMQHHQTQADLNKLEPWKDRFRKEAKELIDMTAAAEGSIGENIASIKQIVPPDFSSLQPNTVGDIIDALPPTGE